MEAELGRHVRSGGRARSRGNGKAYLAPPPRSDDLSSAEQKMLLDELDDFFENGPGGVHFVSFNGHIMRANKAELALLGYLGRAGRSMLATPCATSIQIRPSSKSCFAAWSRGCPSSTSRPG